MNHNTDSEQLTETSRCLAVSVFLTTNRFINRAILCHDSICLSAMYSLYMLYMVYKRTYVRTYVHTYNIYIHTHKYKC